MAERSGAKLPAGLPCPTSHAFCIMRLSRRTFIKALGCELLAGARCPIARKRHLAGQSFKNRQHVWVRIALPGHRSSLVTGRRAEYLRACAPAGQTRSTGIAKSRAGIPEVPCRIKAWRSAERSGANYPQRYPAPRGAPVPRQGNTHTNVLLILGFSPARRVIQNMYRAGNEFCYSHHLWIATVRPGHGRGGSPSLSTEERLLFSNKA